ncbi:MAG: transcription-repair coupling factor [Tissierellia bacterium]|nr:transcription-repair coupling factor [Tissierellia bacterium]
MEKVLEQLKKLPEYQRLVDSMKKNQSTYLYGPVTESFGYLLQSIYHDMDSSIVFIADSEQRAKKLYESLEGYVKGLSYFPSDDPNFYDIESLDKQTEKQRLTTLSKVQKRKTLVFTTPMAMGRKLSAHNVYKKNRLWIDEKSIIDLEELGVKLTAMNYERVHLVENGGQFAIRGGIVDIYPTGAKDPFRMELFGDEIDSIRRIHVDSQRSYEKVDGFEITPAREFIITDGIRKKLGDRLEKEIERFQDKYLYGIDKEKLLDKYQEILGRLRENLTIHNMDLLRPFLYRTEYSTLMDYLPKDSLIIFDDLTRVYDHYENYYKNYLEDYGHQIENGEVFEHRENIIHDTRTMINQTKIFPRLNMTSLLKRTRLMQPKELISINTREAPGFQKRIDVFANHMKDLLMEGYRIVIFTGGDEALLEIIKDYDLPFVKAQKDTKIQSSILYISDLNLREGFEIPETKTLFITKKEIYGVERRHRRRKKKKSARDIINYEDLEIGDYVVHENHGIGRYQGMEQVEIRDIIKDFIVIQYRGNDRLLIPTDQMNMVQKYIGKDAGQPRVNKLSDSTWQRTKQKAKKAVDEIAEDLVKLYAKRSKMKGYAFRQDTQWQKEFEDSFIYEETYGQLRSVAEIKKDMESIRPMDRILCADVGYGKTEVAIRAAFKAVMDGKQVAFLVPTTILAKQHYETMVDRMKDYPIAIGELSRFKTAKEQREIIDGLKKGFYDIVVGTHRLLSKSVDFKDLGLLIVDEEQRFGVRHKEQIKALKENVDVLTLSATPIPRTLQMGLTGIRDMSVIDEPPEERFPTNTYVTEFNEDLIRDAIYREINRGGQVYFVYNRVESIEKMGRELQKLVPEAVIGIAHGQLSEKVLEDVMMAFEEGELDLLLCTTIIETGMDIQNVNTMIVYNADYMGLSQLYQLKGRIGRSDRTSFAYFTYQKGKVLTEVAEKRLKAIKDFTDFGSGFKIAMRDLELRGAGNLLGESQHGHIAAVGYDLYVKMLEQAIRKVKGEKTPELEDVAVEIKVTGYIPDGYIPESNEKITMYKKIASIEDDEDYSDLIDELIDRFGEVPKPVINIMDIAYLKAVAKRLNITQIKELRNELYFYFKRPDDLGLDQIKSLNEEFDNLVFSLVEPVHIKTEFDKDMKKALEILLTLEHKKQGENL